MKKFELAEHPLFEGIATSALPLQDVRTIQLSQGQNLFDQDDVSFDVFFPRKGRLLAVYLAPSGKEILFSGMDQATYFGELAALDGLPRSLAVYAAVDSEVYVLKRAAFLNLLDTQPVLRERLFIDLVARIRSLTDKVCQIATQTVDQRVKVYLAHLALQNGQFKRNGRLEHAPTHAEIASTIGANREAVSRAFADLKRAKVLEAGRRNLTILEPDAFLEGV